MNKIMSDQTNRRNFILGSVVAATAIGYKAIAQMYGQGTSEAQFGQVLPPFKQIVEICEYVTAQPLQG